MSKQLLLPSEVHEKLARCFYKQHQQWLSGSGNWPLVIKLGLPVESDVSHQVEAVRQWIVAWQCWQGPGVLVWCEKRWRILGVQRLPEKLILNNASEVAKWLGEHVRFERAGQRYQRFFRKWTSLAPIMPRYFEVLADYAEKDIDLLERILEWISEHPQSNLYPRQLPLAGLATKWLEQRKGLIGELLKFFEGQEPGSLDFYKRSGLKPLPVLLRLRILDPALRAKVGGLEDITAPIENIAALNLSIKRVYIVENLQTGLAFSDIPGSIVIVALGYSVDLLAKVPWLLSANCYYWGDIDTHGFAILNRARSYLPHLQSILMDETTFLQHQLLWGFEDKKRHLSDELPQLTKEEHELYSNLKKQSWGVNLRLEQEKISWHWAWEKIGQLL